MRPYKDGLFAEPLGEHRRQKRRRKTAGNDQQEDDAREIEVLQIVLRVIDRGGHVDGTERTEHADQNDEQRGLVFAQQFEVLDEGELAVRLSVVEPLFGALVADPERRDRDENADESDDGIENALSRDRVVADDDGNKDGDGTRTDRAEKTRDGQNGVPLLGVGGHRRSKPPIRNVDRCIGNAPQQIDDRAECEFTRFADRQIDEQQHRQDRDRDG